MKKCFLREAGARRSAPLARSGVVPFVAAAVVEEREAIEASALRDVVSSPEMLRVVIAGYAVELLEHHGDEPDYLCGGRASLEAASPQA